MHSPTVKSLRRYPGLSEFPLVETRCSGSTTRCIVDNGIPEPRCLPRLATRPLNAPTMQNYYCHVHALASHHHHQCSLNFEVSKPTCAVCLRPMLFVNEISCTLPSTASAYVIFVSSVAVKLDNVIEENWQLRKETSRRGLRSKSESSALASIRYRFDNTELQ